MQLALLWSAFWLGISSASAAQAEVALDGSSAIQPRQLVPPVTLTNNVPSSTSILPGQTQYWAFPASQLAGAVSSEEPDLPFDVPLDIDTPMNGQFPLHLTLSICRQPQPITGSPPLNPPPSLSVYISYDSANTNPGPNSNTLNEGVDSTSQGFLRYPTHKTGDTYVGVYAPIDRDFDGGYTYRIAASNAFDYDNVYSWPGMVTLDTDTQGGLFLTNNLSNSTTETDAWFGTDTPFSLFVHDQSDVMIQGVLQSYCGLETYATIQVGTDKNSNVSETGMTILGAGALPKQQFYAGPLNGSSTYYAVLGLDGNYSTVDAAANGGGSTVWKPLSVTTKSDNNCQLLYNLSFCDNVAWAVPSNPLLYQNYSALATAYDNQTLAQFVNFNYSLQCIACDIQPSQQYSLAVTCQNCSDAYKEWLCAVTMPRCTDFGNDSPYLQPRNVAQAYPNASVPALVSQNPMYNGVQQPLGWGVSGSRAPWIDSTIQPGPYKEVLPCADLCYALVQTCPAQMGFGCPWPGLGQNISYGMPLNGSIVDGLPTCNWPGRVWGVSAGNNLRMTCWGLLITVFVMALQFG